MRIARNLGKLAAGIVVCAAAFGVHAGAQTASGTGRAKTPSTTATQAPKPAVKPSPSSTAAKKTVAAKRPVRPRIQMAPTPDRIEEIQAALASAGSYHGDPNGKWDQATIDAMKDFQGSHGLAVTGKIDALTLEKLGLGSEIAGKGAPLPQPQASATSDTQTQP